MQTYQVYMKNTDSCFFDGEASSREDAIAQAEAEYYEMYPECEGESVEWSVVDLAEITVNCVVCIQPTVHDYEDYKNLWSYEKLAINSYMLGNDTGPLKSIMKSDILPSKSMRDFNGDFLDGNIRRKASKSARTIFDKMECYRVINALMAGRTLDEALDS